MSQPRLSSILNWAQAAILIGNLAWTTLCLGGYLAETVVVTSLLTAALLFVHGLALLVAARQRGDGDQVPGGRGARAAGIHPAGWCFVPFLVYAAVNVGVVSPVRWLGWFDWFGWAQMVAVFWVVLNLARSRRIERALLGALYAVAIVGVLLACYQRFVDSSWLMLHRTQAEQYVGRASGPFGIPNSFAAFLLLLLPLGGALAMRRAASAVVRVLFGWVTLVLLLGLGLTVSRGAWLGLGVALTAWPLLAPGRTLRRRMAIAAATCAAVLLVGTLTYFASPVVRERFVQLAQDLGERSRPILWRAALQMVRDHPFVGTGAGSYNAVFEQHRPEGFINQPDWVHNDYLNTLSDYGSIGFGLFFGAVAVLTGYCLRARTTLGADAGGTVKEVDGTRAGRRSRRDVLDDPMLRQAHAVGLLAFGLQLFVDFHFKLPALAMVFAVMAALLVRRRWSTGQPLGGSALAVAVVGVGCLAAGIGIACWITPKYRGESIRAEARRSIDRIAKGRILEPIETVLPRALAATTAATTLDGGNAQAWADRAYILAQLSRIETTRAAALGAQAEADADRAISLSPIVAEYWVRRGVGRDLQGRWYEAGEDFTHAMLLSPKAVLPWYHYAYHLSLRTSGRGLARAMVEVCLRLDPGNAEALALRQRLATGQNRP